MKADEELFLGIDLGTSSVKAVLVDSRGAVVASEAQTYPIDIPAPGRAEQDPAAWWSAACAAVRRVIAAPGVSAGAIAGVGLSGQMHGLAAINGRGEPARPAIIWCDQRSSGEVAWVKRRIGRDRLAGITFNPVTTGFMLPSLLWVRKHEPEIYRRISTVLFPKDYIRFRLCGERGTDYSDASAGLLFNVERRCWSDELIDAAGLDRSMFPVCSEATDVVGTVSAAAARETGLAPGTPVVAGGADQPMQAIGNAVIRPGDISVTIGTGGQVFAATARPVLNPALNTHTFCHALPDLWYVLGATLNAGLAFRWLRDLFGQDVSFDSLAAEAEGVQSGAQGLVFLPYLIGERTPHMDPGARGLFFGLTLAHTRAHLARAVMEGVVFALKDGFEAIRSLGLDAGRLVASGGGSQASLWLQLQADILNRELIISTRAEQAAFGAAIAAAVGAGIHRDIPAACSKLVSLSADTIKPDPRRAEAYEKRFGLFKRLYRANRSLFRDL